MDFYEGSGADPGLDVVEVVQPFKNEEIWKDEDHGNGACSGFGKHGLHIEPLHCGFQCNRARDPHVRKLFTQARCGFDRVSVLQCILKLQK